MGLEDIPNVQILEFRDSVKWNFEKHPSYNGKFIAMRDKQGKNYLFSIVSIDPNELLMRQHKDLVYIFNMNAIDDYNVSNPGSEFNVTGGGKIKVSSESVSLYDKSEKYGEFNRSDIESIIKDYMVKNLPKHTLSFE